LFDSSVASGADIGRKKTPGRPAEQIDLSPLSSASTIAQQRRSRRPSTGRWRAKRVPFSSTSKSPGKSASVRTSTPTGRTKSANSIPFFSVGGANDEA